MEKREQIFTKSSYVNRLKVTEEEKRRSVDYLNAQHVQIRQRSVLRFNGFRVCFRHAQLSNIS